MCLSVMILKALERTRIRGVIKRPHTLLLDAAPRWFAHSEIIA